MDPENVAMKLMARTFANRQRYEQAQKLALLGQLPFKHGGVINSLPGPLASWTALRDLQPVPKQSFRDWWRSRKLPQEAEQEARS
jgi:L-lactate dehydrogenase complex protein LldF